MLSHKLPALAALSLIWSAAAAWAQETLILAPNQFLDELQPLKNFKDATCRPTILLGLDQVYSNFTGADEAEQVKRCIAHYQQTAGVQYVLLAGDIDQFPARSRWWGLTNQEGWAVSDLYYADLYKHGTTTFDDWDANKNGLYGEIEFSPNGFINNDNIDFLPDVAVGRIPGSTKAEVAAYVRKAINYELKTTESAAWFKRAGLYTGGWPDANNGAVMDQIGSSLSAHGFTLTKRYWDWTPDPPDFPDGHPPPGVPGAVISDVNQGVGFMAYIGHGSPGGWQYFGTGDLSGLFNSNRLPIVFAAACDTAHYAPMGRFEAYLDTAGGEHWGAANGEDLPVGAYPHSGLPRPACVQNDHADGGVWHAGLFYPFDLDCFAERILFGNPVGDTGAVAYIGERTGGQVTAPELARHFFAAYDNGQRFLGDLWIYALQQYYNQHNLGSANTWSRTPKQWGDGHVFDEPQKFHLFGDPSLVVGGAFSVAFSGTQYDWPWPLTGPLYPLSRYRVTADVTVPPGHRLTAQDYHSFLFESACKITALDTDAANGFIVNAAPDRPVCFIALSADPQAQRFMRGIKVTGQLRLRGGGAIKLHGGP